MTPTTPAPAATDGPVFRWADVPAADRPWLRDATEQIHFLAHRVGISVVGIGLAIAAAKERLPRGLFERWLAAELPWSPATARRLMAIGRTFKDYTTQVERIERSALYVLTDTRVPAAAREYAIELADDGQTVTHALARQIVAAHKERLFVHRADVAGLAPLRREDKPTAAAPARPPSPEERAWAALEHLARANGMVHVGVIADEPGDVLWSVTTQEGGRPRALVRSSLAECVLQLAEREAERRCPRCGQKKKEGEFGTCRAAADGRARCCKACERARIKAIKQRQKAAKDKAKKGPGRNALF